jgi:hypothetical protein
MTASTANCPFSGKDCVSYCALSIELGDGWVCALAAIACSCSGANGYAPTLVQDETDEG